MSRPIRVAHVIQNLNYGGMERVLSDLVQMASGGRFEFHVITLQYAGRFATGLDRHATLHVPPPMGRLSLLRPQALAGLLRRIAPDIVHSHSGVWLKAATAARLAGVPAIVHTDHGRASPDPLIARIVDHVASRRTTVVVAVSDALADVLRATVVARGTPIEVIVNGVDVERFQPGAPAPGWRSELRLPPGVPVIGSVGRLEPIKHYDLALRALARTGASPAPCLLLAGDGSERAALERLAAELGVAERVRILGWRDDVERLQAGFDLFTLTSRSEGTSISLLEAMSAGLPVVVTDVGGNRAVLGPSADDQLVPADDPEALARAWDRVVGSPALRAALGRANRDRACRAYSVTRMVEAYRALYQRLAGVGPR